MEKVLIIGLGNAGKHFATTRHNLGIATVRSWVETQAERADVTPWQEQTKWHAAVAAVRYPERTVYCLFPLTMMNDSGNAVAQFVQTTPFTMDHLLIVHDDLEVPFGEIRRSDGGSAKGHNGVRSIHATLGTTAMPRLRLGIGRPSSEVPTDEYVLQPFTATEQTAIPDLHTQVHTAIEQWLQSVNK